MKKKAPATLSEWADYMSELVHVGTAAAENLRDPGDPYARQDLYRQLHKLISEGFFALQYQDPRYPEFWPIYGSQFSWGFPTPDDVYFHTVIDDTGRFENGMQCACEEASVKASSGPGLIGARGCRCRR